MTELDDSRGVRCRSSLNRMSCTVEEFKYRCIPDPLRRSTIGLCEHLCNGFFIQKLRQAPLQPGGSNDGRWIDRRDSLLSGTYKKERKHASFLPALRFAIPCSIREPRNCRMWVWSTSCTSSPHAVRNSLYWRRSSSYAASVCFEALRSANMYCRKSSMCSCISVVSPLFGCYRHRLLCHFRLAGRTAKVLAASLVVLHHHVDLPQVSQARPTGLSHEAKSQSGYREHP